MSILIPDLDLIRKYNQPGPRYTSYPTAPHFADSCPTAQLAAEPAKDRSPLSLYFHIPFCRKLCWFCGCTTIISTQQDRADQYLDYLEKEIDLLLPSIEGRKVHQLHFGGGTPNFLSPAQILRFSKFLHERFEFAPDAEMSAEFDPRTLDKARLDAFVELGINRASIGVQDVREEVQKAINRVQPHEVNVQVLEWLRAAGISSINMDLIYGLPFQTPETFQETLDQAIAYAPTRFAVFSYAHVPWIKPAQKILEAKTLPEPDEKIKMLGRIISTLTSADYHYIGMDHFAAQDDPLTIAHKNKTLQRNFQGYSTHAGLEICAFGMSSISQTARSYRQNYKELDQYCAALDEGRLPIERGLILNDDDLLRRDIIMSLMCHLEIDYAAKSAEHGIDFKAHFDRELEELKPMQDDGLIQLEDDKFTITQQGTLFIRNIAMKFDAYLAEGKGKYSKTV